MDESEMRSQYESLGNRQKEIHMNIAMLNRELVEIGEKRIALCEDIGRMVINGTPA